MASEAETTAITRDTSSKPSLARWSRAERWWGRGARGEDAVRGGWRSLAAEGAGTALLVLLSCLAACGSEQAPRTQRALAGGLVVALVVQCFDHVSGAQVNPAVTLAALVYGRLSARVAAAEAGAQLAGAVLGAALLALLAPPHAATKCLTRPALGLPLYKAVLTEAALGACVALANCAAWDARNRLLRDSWPLRLGLSVAALGFVAGDLTGASMNPARSFAPALWSDRWESQWVYWVGPLSGAAAAAALYRAVWHVPPHTPARAAPHAPPAPHTPDTPTTPPAPAAPRTPEPPTGALSSENEKLHCSA